MPSAHSSPANELAADLSRAQVVSVACVVATIAFWAYSRTLLPGVDLGDTGGFQAAVLWPETSARQGYPLYYALAKPFVALVSAGNPARGLNLFSAVWAAIASGLLTFITATVLRSIGSGLVAGLLLAASYTFWTQAIIAEVYSLHLALVGMCLIALHAFAAKPTRMRLAIFLAIYAMSFGNHLSMILLLVPFTVFLLQAIGNPRELFRPAVVGLAIAIAALGTLQYIPDFIATWTSIDGSEHWYDRLAAFWFDATKADWREQSVMGIRVDDMRDRLAMWLWDARQQFGVAGLGLSLFGGVRFWWISRAWASLVWTAFVFSTLFALTYNVGDAHVFFLSGHFWTAFAAGAAFSRLDDRSLLTRKLVEIGGRRIVTLTLLCASVAYAGWRGWSTWPAVDRHEDHRGADLVSRIAFGVSDRHTLLVTQMDWQAENALLYESRFERPDLTWIRLADVLLHFPFLVRDNQRIGRDLVLTEYAAAEVVATYGPVFPLARDETLATPTILEQVETIPSGTPYVLCLLTPTSDQRLGPDDVRETLRALTGNHAPAWSGTAYEVVAGLKGQVPLLHRASNRPFTDDIALAGDTFKVRMDSWLPSDTFRRGGFGHVLRGRDHVLLVERGLSLVWMKRGSSPAYAYAAGLYAPQPRYRINGRVAQLASSRR